MKFVAGFILVLVGLAFLLVESRVTSIPLISGPIIVTGLALMTYSLLSFLKRHLP